MAEISSRNDQAILMSKLAKLSIISSHKDCLKEVGKGEGRMNLCGSTREFWKFSIGLVERIMHRMLALLSKAVDRKIGDCLSGIKRFAAPCQALIKI